MARARRWLAVAAVGVVVNGCASFSEVWDSWTGTAPAAPPTIAPTAADVFYAGSENLGLHEFPSGASPIVARLALHQRVTRINVSRGYAQVQTDAGLQGWVDTVDLLWRLPAAPEAAPAVAGETVVPLPVASETVAPAPAAAPMPETPVVMTPEPIAPVPGTAAEVAPATTPATQPTPAGWTWRNLFPGAAAEAPPAPTAADTAVPAETVAATPIETAPVADTPIQAPPETPVEAAPPPTPTAAEQPTPARRGLRSLFP